MTYIFQFYANLEAACYLIQKKIFGSYADETWGNRMNRMTAGIMAFIIVFIFFQYVHRNIWLACAAGIIPIALLFFYYSNKRYNPVDIEKKLSDFNRINLIIRYGYILYIMITVLIVPVLLLYAVLFK